jgi:ribonuclease Y
MHPAILGLITGVLGLGGGYIARAVMGRYWAQSMETRARQLAGEAEREADAVRKEAQIQSKAEAIKLRENFEKSTQTRRRELADLETRIAERETNLERKVAMIEKKDKALDEKIGEAERRNNELAASQERAAKLESEHKDRLQVVAGMTRDQARDALLERVEKEIQGDIGGLIRRRQEEARETAEREAKKIVAQAIERYAASHASEMMTSTVALPNDDMKGRIIGRDGRNIRALEAATGVNILIDDTPEAVVISGFDPVRREVARVSLERLIADGRIHPARIEEVVAKAQENMEEAIRSAGEEAAYSAGVQSVPPELIRMLGRLRFRTSFAQNVLQHSLEVAHLMGVMAGELGLDSNLAKRIGLFHDIGKALDHEVEGGHAVIGADVLRKHNESAALINAVAAHHEEVEPETMYALLASAADAISSSRVGARSETTDIYAKRLEQLERIANGFEGVEKSYAIQAGREVRVLVQPDKVDDNGAMAIARGISQKIASDLQYPGQIRVMVIRETRCVEYAR